MELNPKTTGKNEQCVIFSTLKEIKVYLVELREIIEFDITGG